MMRQKQLEAFRNDVAKGGNLVVLHYLYPSTVNYLRELIQIAKATGVHIHGPVGVISLCANKHYDSRKTINARGSVFGRPQCASVIVNWDHYFIADEISRSKRRVDNNGFMKDCCNPINSHTSKSMLVTELLIFIVNWLHNSVNPVTFASAQSKEQLQYYGQTSTT